MEGQYVGHVSRHDRVYEFLSSILHEQFGIHAARPSFRAFHLSGSNEVYGYQEKHSRACIIGKFYGTQYVGDADRAAATAWQEYDSLERLRSYRLVGSPHHVIRPLGVAPDINGVLAVEYYSGELLSHAIAQATQRGNSAHLMWRLRALAYFLATLHNRTANGSSVDFGSDCRYFDKVVSRLRRGNRIGQWDADELLWLRDLWRDRERMWRDKEVWLHGDATPANFLFGRDMDVAAIDLERMKRGDRMFDVGRIAGELQHAFMSATGDRWRAEPFIGHFLWEYCCHFPDRDKTFASVTTRVPYYMGLTLLRIARNHYVADDYRRRLVDQAKVLLRAS